MHAIRLPNGQLLIPADEGDPTAFDGLTEIGPDCSEYNAWLAKSQPGTDPRRSRADFSVELYNRGRHLGRSWATRSLQGDNPGDRLPLISLKEFYRKNSGPEWESSFERGQWVTTPLQNLHLALFPDFAGDLERFRQFILAAFGDDNEDHHRPAFVRGFAEGALEASNDLGD